MKKSILLCVLALIVAAATVWFILMDPVSVRREDVASIEVYYYNQYPGADGDPITIESEFTITDENHIHYITDFLNNLLPIPCESGYFSFYRELTMKNEQGDVLCTVTIPDHESIITDHGTFAGDLGELNNNLSNIEEGEDIVTNMQFFGLLLISWLFVIVLVGFAGLIMFLIQMAICYKTDSLSLRLLPAEILILFWLFGYHTVINSAFYWASILGFSSGEFGVYLLTGFVVLCMVLGWHQGATARTDERTS